MTTLDIPTKPQKTTAVPETSIKEQKKGGAEAQQKSAAPQKRSAETLDIPTKPRQSITVLRNSLAVPEKRSTETLDIPTSPRKRTAKPQKKAVTARKSTVEARKSSTLAEKHIAAKKLRTAVPKVSSATPKKKSAGTREIPTQPHQRIAIAGQILTGQEKRPDLPETRTPVVQNRTTGMPKHTGVIGKEPAGIEGYYQREEDRRTWRILPFLLLVVWTSCLTIFLAWVIRVTIPLSVNVSLNSILHADYSADPLGWYFPSLDFHIILDVLQGQDPETAQSAYATLVSQRLTPVATVTPNGTTTPWLMPSPTSGITPTITPVSSLTPSPTVTSSPMLSGTPITGTPTPTFTLTLYPGGFKTATSHHSPTPTRRVSTTRTIQPIETNTPEHATQTPQPTRTRPTNPTQTTRPTSTRDPYPYP